jgi:transposase
MPVYHALLEHGDFATVLAGNAGHVKNVPGGTVLADLAKGVMRKKIPDLSMALEGRFGDHHALMCRLHLDHIDHLEAMPGKLDAQIEEMMEPLSRRRRPAEDDPGDRAACRRRGHLPDRR